MQQIPAAAAEAGAPPAADYRTRAARLQPQPAAPPARVKQAPTNAEARPHEKRDQSTTSSAQM